jgi:hypothetical protein
VSGQHHAPAALYARGKSPRYPLYRRLGGPQSRSECLCRGSNLGRPVRSQTLYWLSYHGSQGKSLDLLITSGHTSGRHTFFPELLVLRTKHASTTAAVCEYVFGALQSQRRECCFPSKRLCLAKDQHRLLKSRLSWWRYDTLFVRILLRYSAVLQLSIDVSVTRKSSAKRKVYFHAKHHSGMQHYDLWRFCATAVADSYKYHVFLPEQITEVE